MQHLHHVAIIMDGNRRWARRQGVDELEGHRAGVEKLREMVDGALEEGIEFVTVWAFSTKNFGRTQAFVAGIMGVFRETLDNRDWWNQMKEKGVEIRIIGNLDLFPTDIVDRIDDCLKEKSEVPTRLVLTIGLGYEGRDEIVRAAQKAIDAGETKMDQERFASYLDTVGVPDPDLIIRTGGDVRLSGFLLWQMADAELYFCETLWPDFGKKELKMALDEYRARERRFGK